jgi:hypothetical protein
MAMYAKDGSKHHSASRASLHDEMNERGKSLKSSAGKDNPTPTAGASKDVSHMDIKEVVAKHGPAHEVHVKHDHAAGAHHVTSHHKGAHHKSTHGSAHEAHMHGAMAAGHEGEDENETPDEAMNESPMDEESEGSIPGMT